MYFRYLLLLVALCVAVSSVVVEALCYKPEGHGYETRWGERIFSIYLIFLVAQGLGIYPAFTRNEYQKQKNKVSAE
jgi:hypothetical protein